MSSEEQMFLNREEVANLCHVAYQTVYRWEREGKIKAYGFGNRALYKKSEILDKIMGR
jgi:excisionase family DNA binding protein